MGKNEGMAAIQNEINDLLAKLEAAKAKAREERKALRNSVKRQWCFTWRQVTNPRRLTFDPIRENSEVEVWELIGTISNKEELKAVGYVEGDRELSGGSMFYLVNRLNNRIITTTGGGSLFISGSRSFYGGKPEERETIIAEGNAVYAGLERIIASGSKMEDVTDLITGQLQFQRSWC